MQFLCDASFVLVGSLEGGEEPWASLLFSDGVAPFITTPDDTTLQVHTLLNLR